MTCIVLDREIEKALHAAEKLNEKDCEQIKQTIRILQLLAEEREEDQ